MCEDLIRRWEEFKEECFYEDDFAELVDETIAVLRAMARKE